MGTRKIASPAVGNDREALVRMTKGQLIDRLLAAESTVMKSRVFQTARTGVSDAPKPVPTPTATVVFAPHRGFLTVSDEINRMFGRQFSSFSGLEQFTCFEAYRPDGTRYAAEEWPFIRSLKTGEHVYDEEMQILREDGSVLIVLISSSFVTSATGNFIVFIVKDLTHQTALIQALRSSEERFCIAQQLSPDGFTILHPIRDDSGRVVDFEWVYQNDAIAAVTRHKPNALIGRRLLEIFPGHRGSAFFEAYKHVAETGENRLVEESYQGETIVDRTWFRLVVVPVGGDIAILAQDITDRKRAEETLQANERTLRLFTEHAPAAIAMFDTSMRYVAVSRRWLSDFALGDRDIMGLSHYEVFPEISDRWKEIHQRCLSGAVETCDEDPFPRADGKVDWVRWEVRPWHDQTGKIGGIIIFSELITERKQMQEALQRSHDDLERRVKERTAELLESHERFRSLVELLPEMVFETDSQGRYTYGNRQALETFGLTLEELCNLHIRDIVVERDYPRMREGVDRVLCGEVRPGAEYVLRKRDGVEFPAFVRASRIERNGEVKGVRGIVIDLTRSRKAEADRQLLEEQFRETQKMEAVGTLAGGIAHDFNNMLAVIIGNAELAYDDDNVNDIRANLVQILNASKRSRDLVKQILTFSRKSEGQKKPMRLTPLVKETAELLRGSLINTISLKVAVLSKSTTVLGNPSQIQQVLMNLATNAAHAIGEEGGTLAIRLSEIVVREGDHRLDNDMKPGRYVKLSVRDTGCGIPADVRQRIFDPFFTTKQPGEGTGMGLAVVFGIVKSHGGAITVASKIGKGSIFTVFLPLVNEASGEESTNSLPLVTGTERLLVIDDESAVIDVVSQTLKRAGYRVTTARSGSEGWRKFELNPYRFDLVITDHIMPEITGMKLSEKMLKVRPDLPIILSTGYSETVSSEQAALAGISEFLMKPVEGKKLAQVVRKVLDQRAGGPERMRP